MLLWMEEILVHAFYPTLPLRYIWTLKLARELKEKGIVFDFDKVKQEITQRDENDKNREFSPLKMADDAIFFDSTYKTAEEVKNEIINIINERF